MEIIAERCDGDARMALNLADACASCVLHSQQKCGNVETMMAREISREMIESAMTQRFVRYDNRGEEHYHIASALQKSIVCTFSGS